jgi:hypothetical protein
VEPFCHSAAVLLARPHPPRVETLNDPAGDVTNAWRALHPEGGDQGAVATELLNDLDPYIANVWRSIQAEPEETARWADNPVHELDLHAFHRWLVLGEDAAAFRERLRTDPDYYCPRRAGRWLAGACMWIGGGWATDPGGPPVHSPHGGSGDKTVRLGSHGHGGGDGVHAKGPRPSGQVPDLSSGSVDTHAAGGLSQQIPDLRGDCGAHGSGVHASGMTAAGGPVDWSQRPVIGHGGERGVHADLPQGRPQLADAYSRGRGVHDDNHLSEKRPHIGGGGGEGPDATGNRFGSGIHARGDTRPGTEGTCEQRRAWLVAWFARLRDRLRTVRVCCGDFMRVIDSESVTTRLGVTGIFADPPYPSHRADGSESRSGGLYATDGGKDALADIRDRLLAYCLERGGNPKMRIAVCGYSGDGYAALLKHGWEEVAWRPPGGYANRNKANKNRGRERIWFSPHCLKAREPGLFDTIDEGGVP